MIDILNKFDFIHISSIFYPTSKYTIFSMSYRALIIFTLF